MNNINNNNSNNINRYWGTQCIILTRVSTKKQDFDAQNSDLERYAKSLGFEKIEIIATKESGFKNFKHKEGFAKVVDYLNNNKQCRTIFVTELSRIGRDRQVITNIEYYLRENKINLIVKDSNLRMFDDVGDEIVSSRLMFSIYASFAESEMRQKKERFTRAKKQLYSEGYSLSHSCFGYKKVYDEQRQKNKLIIDEIQAEQVKKVFEMYINGINGDRTKSSIRLITLECIKLGFDRYLHSKRNVNKCLKEQAYTGHKVTNNKMKNPEYWDYQNENADKYVNANSYEIKYPVIISESLFNSVQAKLNTMNNETDKSKHTTILSKMIVCPVCKNYYKADYRVKDGVLKHNYQCSGAKHPVNPCANKQTLSMIMLDSVVWSFVKANVSELISNIEKQFDNVSIEEIERQIENINSKINNYEDDKNTETQIFRTLSRNAKDKKIIFADYQSKINAIDLKIEQLRAVAAEQKQLIESIELSQKTNKEDVKNKIINIEQNKAEIKKYIRMLIKNVQFVYSDVYYTVLKLTNIENMGYSLNLGADGLKANIQEFEYYLIINKKNNRDVKVKYIECFHPVQFIDNQFVYNGKNVTLDYIFKHQNRDTADVNVSGESKLFKKLLSDNFIHFNLKDVEYKRFDNELYSEDEKMSS